MKKILRGLLVTLLLLLSLFLAAYFYIGARAEKILAELVERETGGKLKTDIDKVRFNWKQMNLTLTGSRFYSADTISEPTTYEIKVQKLVLELSALRPLLFERRLLFDTIACTRPSILVTKRKEHAREKFVLTSEMNKVYRGLSKIVNNLNVRYCVVDSGSFSLVNRVQSAQLPVTVTDFYLRIDNLKKDDASDSDKRSLFTDRIKFYSSRQDILFPDGRHRLRYKNFRINSAKRYIEIDSCYFSRKTDAAASNGLEVFVDTLRLTGVDFYGLTSSGLISADSALCINSRINFNTRLHPGVGRSVTLPGRMDRDSAAQLVKQLLGDIRIKYLGLLNAGLELRTEFNGKANSYSTRRSDFIMEDIAIINSPDSPLKIGSFRFGIQGYRAYDADSMYAVRFDKISFANSDVQVDGFSILPTSRNLAFTDRKAITMQALRLEGMEWPELLLNRKLAAASITLIRPDLRIHAPGGGPDERKVPIQIFSVLGKLSRQIDVRTLKIRDASIDYALAAQQHLQLEKVNLAIGLGQLLRSGNREELLRSLSGIAFAAGTFQTKGSTLKISDGLLDIRNRSMHAAGLRLSDGRNVLQGSMKNVDVEKIAVSELSGISASAFRWERADLLLRPAAGGVKGKVEGTTSRHSPSVSFGSLSGKKTTFAVKSSTLDLRLIVDKVQSGNIHLQPGRKPVVEGLKLEGRSLDFKKGKGLDLTAESFSLQDGKPSRLEEVTFFSGEGKTAISLNVPEYSFVPRLSSLMNGENVFGDMTLQSPRISISVSDTGSMPATGKAVSGRLPLLQINSLRIKDPVFVRLPGEFSRVLTSDSVKTDWMFQDIRSDGDNITLGKGKFSASGLGLNTDRLSVQIPAGGMLSAECRSLVFTPARVNRQSSWSGVLSLLTLPQSRLVLDRDDGVNTVLDLKGVRISELQMNHTQKISAGDWLVGNPLLKLELDRVTATNEKVQLDCSGLAYRNGAGELRMDSLSVIPRIDRDSFNRLAKYQTDYMVFRTGEVTADGIAAGNWSGDSVYRIRSLALQQPRLHVYKDKRLPFNSGVHKPLPTDLLQRIRLPFRIDSIRLHDADVTYEELNDKTLMNGSVRFSGVNANLENVASTGHLSGDSLRLYAAARLLDSIPLRIRFIEAYRDTLHAFRFAFRMSPFDMRLLNPVLVPLVSAKIRKGTLDTMRVNAIGREYLSHGKMKMYYRGLRALYLDNGDENAHTLKTRLITFLANTILLRTNNRSGYGQVYVLRKQDRSIFNYWLKIILSGVVSSTGASSNKKMERKYQQSLKKLNLPEIPETQL